MVKLPFSESTILELMENSNMTREELTQDYTRHLNEEEDHEDEFSNDWTKSDQ